MTAVRAATEAGNVLLTLVPGRYRVSADAGVGEETVEVAHDPDAPATVTARTSAGDVVVRSAG